MVREYVLAASPEDAVRLSSEDPKAVVMGGGSTLMPRIPLGELGAERVIGLAAAEMDYVCADRATTLGAMATLRSVAGLEQLPMLARAARAIAGPALRNTATVGGNLLVDQPYGDLAPPLLALDAELVIQGADGRRTVALADALAGDGVQRGEILAEIEVPGSSDPVGYERLGRRAANSPAVAAAAVRLRRDGDTIVDARVALGALGPRAFRATAAERALVGSPGDEAAIEASATAATDAADPADDPVASAWYRRRMTAVCVRRALHAALGAGRA